MTAIRVDPFAPAKVDSAPVAVPLMLPDDSTRAAMRYPDAPTAAPAEDPYAEAGIRIGLYGDDVRVTPAELLVTDPHGRRLGHDPRTDQSFSEVPHGAYGRLGLRDDDASDEPPEENRELTIGGPSPGTYTIAVVGRASGRYTLEVNVFDADAETLGQALFRGIGTTRGEVHTYTVTLDGTGAAPVAITRRSP